MVIIGDELFTKHLYIFSAIYLIAYSELGMAEIFIFRGHSHDQNNLARAQWESRYVSEGRDNLDGAGIQTTNIDIKYGFFELLLWNGWGYDSEYDELNIIPTLNYKYNNFKAYLNYKRIQFFEDDESENDVGSGISYHGLPYDGFLGFDWYHSFEADGSFYELSLGSNFEPVQKVSLVPTFVFGINNNYISDGHDGANHISLQLNGEYEIAKQFNLTGYVGYNIAIDSNPNSFAGDELLNDFFWGGIGLEVTF